MSSGEGGVESVVNFCAPHSGVYHVGLVGVPLPGSKVELTGGEPFRGCER